MTSWSYSQLAVQGQRHPVAAALSKCLAIGVLELTNPAVGATADLKDATATVAATSTWTAADLKSAGLTKLSAHGARALTFTTAGVTPADAPATVVITGKDINGDALSETLALSQIAAAVTSVKCYSSITSLAFAAGDGVNGTIAAGISDKFGLASKAKSRGGGVAILREIVAGAVVGVGSTTTAVNQTTVATNQAATATNQAATATNQADTATNQNATATNQNATATNDATTFAGFVKVAAPIAEEVISVIADVLMADGAQIIAAQPDWPRKLRVNITDADSSVSAGILTIVGVGPAGQAISEAVDLTGGSAVKVTTAVFATVTSASIAGLVGHAAGDNVGVGVDSALGLPVPAGATSLVVHKTVVDAADETVAGVDATGFAVDPTTAPNAVRVYDFFFSYQITPTQAAHNHTQDAHNHTQDGHNHTQDGHNHTQDTHNHTQDTHNHTQTAHTHNAEGTSVAAATSLPYGAWTPGTAPDGAKDFALYYEVDVA